MLKKFLKNNLSFFCLFCLFSIIVLFLLITQNIIWDEGAFHFFIYFFDYYIKSFGLLKLFDFNFLLTEMADYHSYTPFGYSIILHTFLGKIITFLITFIFGKGLFQFRIISYIFGLIGLIYSYKFGLVIFKEKRLSIFFVFLTCFSSLFLILSGINNYDIPITTLLIIGYYYLYHFWITENFKYLNLTGIFFGLAVLFKEIAITNSLGLFLCLIILKFNLLKKKEFWVFVLLYILTILPFILQYFIIEFFSPSVYISSQFNVPISENIKKYFSLTGIITLIYQIISLISFFGILILIPAILSLHKKYIYFLIIIFFHFLIILLFTMFRNIGHELARYLLPLLPIINIFIVDYLATKKIKFKNLYLILFIINMAFCLKLNYLSNVILFETVDTVIQNSSKNSLVIITNPNQQLLIMIKGKPKSLTITGINEYNIKTGEIKATNLTKIINKVDYVKKTYKEIWSIFYYNTNKLDALSMNERYEYIINNLHLQHYKTFEAKSYFNKLQFIRPLFIPGNYKYKIYKKDIL
ncbi:MAG TPA: glycosyltransferase family 39 protein [bacterium]|nr:glycosyltransferase family 39 protein [bacterium]